MSPETGSRALLDKAESGHELAHLLDADAPTPTWLLEELDFAWRDAHEEAAATYDDWRRSPGPEAYSRYRASQDRADTAQDLLHRASATRG
jgi:hypothetical protein